MCLRFLLGCSCCFDEAPKEGVSTQTTVCISHHVIALYYCFTYYQVEDILKEKNMETLDPNESVFVSEDSNYFGSFELLLGCGISDMSSSVTTTALFDSTTGGIGGGSVDYNNSDRSSSEHSPMDCISTIAFFIFER